MTDASSARRFGARAVGLPLVTATLFVVLYAPVAAHLVSQLVTDPNYQHGLAVPVVSGYLLWRRRRLLAATEGRQAILPGAALMVGAAILLIGGTAASEYFTARLSLPIMLIGLLLLFRGAAFVRRAMFPLLFLFMMIPLPYVVYYKLTFPLQIMSAELSARALSFIGIDVIRHGNVLALPTYTLEVIAACSGLRSLMTMVTLAIVLCAFPGLRPMRSIVLVACSIPIAIAANTVRLVVIAVGASTVSPAFADGTLHELSGLIVFTTGFALLLAVRAALTRVG